MNRIVIDIVEFPLNGATRYLLRLGQGIAQPGNGVGGQVLNLDVTTPPLSEFLNAGVEQAQLTMQVGQILFQALTQHLEVNQELLGAFGIPIEECRPIFVNVEATSDLPDQLPWETLHLAAHQFVTLDNRWPVGRMAGRVAGQDRVIQRQVDGEVRLLAVLAAVDASGRDQWLALKEVLTETQLNWSLTVLVSEKGLLDEIQGLQDARMRAEMLRDRDHLLGTIERVKPNLVHFFCHGTAGGTSADGSMASPTLLFCTAADRIVGQSSVVIEAKDLSRHPGLQQSLWLMTLNCCDSSAARGVPSLARSLVNEKLPAVLGMRERIVPQNAHLFCRPFYRSVLRQIIAACEHGGAPADVEWVRALWEPRRELAQLDAARARGWTIPVMYVRPEPFQLRQPPDRPDMNESRRKELEAQLQKLKEYRDSMGLDISPRMLAELEEEIRRIGRLLYA